MISASGNVLTFYTKVYKLKNGYTSLLNMYSRHSLVFFYPNQSLRQLLLFLLLAGYLRLSNKRVYLWDGSAQTVVCVGTL